MKVPIPIIFITVAAIALVIALIVSAVAPPTNTNCPTGSAICVVADMMPGAVTILSTFILLTIIAAIIFVIFYIKTH